MNVENREKNFVEKFPVAIRKNGVFTMEMGEIIPLTEVLILNLAVKEGNVHDKSIIEVKV